MKDTLTFNFMGMYGAFSIISLIYFINIVSFSALGVL